MAQSDNLLRSLLLLHWVIKYWVPPPRSRAPVEDSQMETVLALISWGWLCPMQPCRECIVCGDGVYAKVFGVAESPIRRRKVDQTGPLDSYPPNRRIRFPGNTWACSVVNVVRGAASCTRSVSTRGDVLCLRHHLCKKSHTLDRVPQNKTQCNHK
jgi:hypothetical protein